MDRNKVPENIVWIDRGIIISLVYIILKKYNKLKDKYLIIRQNRIRKFLEFLMISKISEKSIMLRRNVRL